MTPFSYLSLPSTKGVMYIIPKFIINALKRLPTSMRISIGQRSTHWSLRLASLAVEIAPEIVVESDDQ